MKCRIGADRPAVATGVATVLLRCSIFSRWAMIVAIALQASRVQGQVFTDPGFESYSVSSGAFLQPGSGVWLFNNNAGVVEPYAPNSSTGTLYTWSATFSPVEGQQYASTYASLDSIRQTVSFGIAGNYRISVYAAAPDGSVFIPPNGTFTLGNGEFTFTLGNAAIGSTNVVAAGSSWALFAADFSIANPGNYQLGVRNTSVDSYFINYDAFAIQAVPEPTTLQLMLAFGVFAGGIKALRLWGRPVCFRKRDRVF